MALIDTGLELPYGLSLDGQVGIWPTTTDPSAGGGLDLPVGSLALRTDGVLWRKIGATATDWTKKHFDPEKTVMVAKSGGDYTSVKDACDYVDTQTPSGSDPWTVLVFPGSYLEAAFTVPDFCNLISAGGLNSAILTPTVGSTAFVTCGAYSEINGFRISGASGVGGIGMKTADFQSLVRSCTFTNCETGLQITGSGANAILQDCIFTSTPGSTITTGIKVDTGATAIFQAISLSSTTSSRMTTSVLVDGSGTKCTMSACIVSYATTGFKLDGGSFTIMSGSAAEDCTTGFTIDGSTTSAHINSSSARNCTTDINIANSAVTGYFIGSAELQKVNLGGSTKFFFNMVQFQDGDEGVKIVGELTVGHPDRPSESCFGEGDSSVFEMHCLTNTNGEAGTWNDITTALSSPAGSTSALFAGTAAENCFYVGREDAHFEGIKVESISPAMSIGTGAVVVEYWNGTAWTAMDVMETKSGPPYTQRANTILQTADSVQLRFGPHTGWTSKTLNSITAYWMRIRITTAITTSPSAERVKYHVNRTEINSDGTVEHFGDAEVEKEISLSNLQTLTGFDAADYSINVNSDVHVALVYNNRSGSQKDGSGAFFTLPDGINTAKPLEFEFLWAKKDSGSGDVDVDVNLSKVGAGDVLDGTISKQTKSAITTVSGSAHSVFSSTFEFQVPDAQPGDRFFWSHVRDATAGNADDTYNADIYLVAWRLHATFWRS